jgi:hypothetical protein
MADNDGDSTSSAPATPTRDAAAPAPAAANDTTPVRADRSLVLMEEKLATTVLATRK